jgi:hypothetical protein
MSILDKKTKQSLPPKIRGIMKKLQIGTDEIYIKGTAGIASMRYFNDYDFYTVIDRNIGSKKLFNESLRIAKYIIDEKDLYFEKFVIQKKDGETINWVNEDDFNYKIFNNAYNDLVYVKFNFLIYMDERFIESSYDIYFEKVKTEKVISDLMESIKDLEKEKNYYKALKRKFTYYGLLKTDKGIRSPAVDEKIRKLSLLFNSDFGELSRKAANLKALQILPKIEGLTEDDKKKILKNLKDLDVEPKDKIIEQKIKNIDSTINNKVKKIYPYFTI